MTSSGPFTVGDLIGDLRNGKPVSDRLRELARKYKELDPEVHGMVKKAGQDMAKALPDDPFGKRMDQFDDDYKLLRKALEEVGGEEIANDIENEVIQSVKKKAAKWSVKEMLENGGISNEDLERIRDTAQNGDGEQKDIAQHALRELEERGISASP